MTAPDPLSIVRTDPFTKIPAAVSLKIMQSPAAEAAKGRHRWDHAAPTELGSLSDRLTTNRSPRRGWSPGLFSLYSTAVGQWPVPHNTELLKTLSATDNACIPDAGAMRLPERMADEAMDVQRPLLAR